MKKISKLLCCFNSLKTKTIEIYIIILSIIGLLLNIIGICVIPWGYTSKAMEILYIINSVLFAYSFILSIITLIIGKKINRKAIEHCYLNSFVAMCTSLLCIFFNIIIAFGAIPDFKNIKSIEYAEIYDPNGESTVIVTNMIHLVSNGKLVFSIFLIVVNLILWLILLFLWISELIRLKYKINGTYYEYLNDQKNITVENSKNFEYNVIGHDKYGYPLYGKKNSKNIEVIKSSKIKFKSNGKYTIKYDTEDNNILKYSYKEKYNPKYYNKPGNKSVDVIHKLREEKKEKYIEKYISGAVNPYYSNFDIKSASNPSFNNSINPGN